MTRISRNDVIKAAERIAGCVVRTPLVETMIRGHRLWLKCECPQTGGAVALAALMAGKVEVSEGTVAILSGGNVDPQLHARIIASAE